MMGTPLLVCYLALYPKGQSCTAKLPLSKFARSPCLGSVVWTTCGSVDVYVHFLSEKVLH